MSRFGERIWGSGSTPVRGKHLREPICRKGAGWEGGWPRMTPDKLGWQTGKGNHNHKRHASPR